MTEEIKVGDLVEHREFIDSEWSEAIWEVLAICGNYVWMRYKDNVPRSTYVTSLRKPVPKPVVQEVVMLGSTIYNVWGFDSMKSICLDDTHKITFSIIDGEPDCNSIRMEKL